MKYIYLYNDVMVMCIGNAAGVVFGCSVVLGPGEVERKYFRHSHGADRSVLKCKGYLLAERGFHGHLLCIAPLQRVH